MMCETSAYRSSFLSEHYQSINSCPLMHFRPAQLTEHADGQAHLSHSHRIHAFRRIRMQWMSWLFVDVSARFTKACLVFTHSCFASVHNSHTAPDPSISLITSCISEFDNPFPMFYPSQAYTLTFGTGSAGYTQSSRSKKGCRPWRVSILPPIINIS